MRATVLILSLAACGRSSPEVESGPFDPAAAVIRDDDRTRVSVHRKDVPLEWMPIVTETLGGLPMSGMANAAIELSVPREDERLRFSKLTGTVAISCPDSCALGDDRTTYEVWGHAMRFPRIDLGSIELRAEAKAGVLDIRFDMTSGDVEMHGRMRIALADDLSTSSVDGCVRFKESEALVERDPKTAALVQTTGASRGEDGFFSIKLSGTFGAMRRLAQNCASASP